jgi:hydroxyacylglutathione hydrolase
VYAPPRELMPAERASGWLAVRDYQIDTEVTGGETLDVAGIVFEVVAIPGHSPDHVAFHADGCLFSGDLLFAGSVGRVDLAGGDWDALLESARSLTKRYAPETTVYPGHGPPTTLGAEQERNPFLAELRA